MSSPLSQAVGASATKVVRAQLSATERLVEVAQGLSMARQLDDVMVVVRRAARELTGADGATFILREGDRCFYADEDAITPLWKGHRFPMSACVSGWAMAHKCAAVIENIYEDQRVPHDAYRPTFVRSLAVVPIRTSDPVGAIGNYWATPHHATEGEVKLLSALADLTSIAMENVRLYGELQKRVQQAQDAIQLREEFITVAAHELRTPLTALQLQLRSLERLTSPPRPTDDGRVRDRIGRARGVAQRLGTLVGEMLDIAQAEHDGLTLEVDEINLAETARQVVDRFAPAAKSAGCLLEIETVAVRGRWDRSRIEQAISHLISNAIKYGRGKPVKVVVGPNDRGARVTVCDKGAGVTPEAAPQLFKRFGRVGPVANYGGLGLGLYLTRQIAEAHGGTVRFDGAANEGCTFVLELPLAPPGY